MKNYNFLKRALGMAVIMACLAFTGCRGNNSAEGAQDGSETNESTAGSTTPMDGENAGDIQGAGQNTDAGAGTGAGTGTAQDTTGTGNTRGNGGQTTTP